MGVGEHVSLFGILRLRLVLASPAMIDSVCEASADGAPQVVSGSPSPRP